MPRTEVPVQQIHQYLPKGSGDHVLTYLEKHQVKLTITPKRKSILGNYTYKQRGGHHITINGTLNTYAFLITLIHELAHLVAFESYGTKIAPHGQEWKKCFSALLDQFIFTKTFPSDI
ncbi:MAG: SprT-like domain-containing protein, partial [Ferruginibacter sp.]